MTENNYSYYKEFLVLFITKLFVSFFYALPSIFFFILLYQSYHTNQPFYITFLYLFLFLFCNSLGMYTIASNMIDKGISYTEYFSWIRHHIDFFIFVNIGIIFLTFIALSIASLLPAILDTIIETNQESQEYTGILPINPHTHKSGGLSILLIGLVLLCLWIWSYICKIGIRIPAHSDGRYLREDHAIEVIEQYKYKIYVSSILVMLLSGIAIHKTSLLPENLAVVTLPIVFSVVYFFIVHSHLAMWSVVYKEIVTKTFIAKIIL